MLCNLFTHLGCCWPILQAAAACFTQRCQAWQLNCIIHTPAVELHSLSSPTPLSTWAFYLIDPINPPSRDNIWILDATKSYTKWVELVALKRAKGAVVSNFFWDNVVCHFPIRKRLLSNNDTPFTNHMWKIASRLFYWSCEPKPQEMAR